MRGTRLATGTTTAGPGAVPYGSGAPPRTRGPSQRPSLRSVAEGVGRPITQELADQAQELEGQAERIRQQALEIRDRLPDFPGH
ncbi:MULTISPECIES: hypothetical protein [Streptomyces]|uniref:Uncharacterized protein n=1 Tax=Streptomyces eurythermus TaxID=42237 RepID=A0ABW6YP99_9ACTN|nr:MULTISPECIES: hypothetical protein [Streptomyces]QIS74767.1 hypothetical protein HB370_36235 [Streptomyces sp. DSM 40868]WDM10799.1 hypothetical protein J3S85_04070 [Streptomyces lavenduligriseus]